MVELREFTLEEIRVNNGQNGARIWIVLYGSVYDVTDYVDSHPGGPELINEYAGTDATLGFEDYGHSSDAKKMLKKYEIGRLVKDAKGKAKIDEGNGAAAKNSRQRRKFLSVILGPCAST